MREGGQDDGRALGRAEERHGRQAPRLEDGATVPESLGIVKGERQPWAAPGRLHGLGRGEGADDGVGPP